MQPTGEKLTTSPSSATTGNGSGSTFGDLGLKELVLAADTVGLGVLTAAFISHSRRVCQEIEELKARVDKQEKAVAEIQGRDIDAKNVDVAVKRINRDITRQGKKIADLELAVSELRFGEDSEEDSPPPPPAPKHQQPKKPNRHIKPPPVSIAPPPEDDDEANQSLEESGDDMFATVEQPKKKRT